MNSLGDTHFWRKNATYATLEAPSAPALRVRAKVSTDEMCPMWGTRRIRNLESLPGILKTLEPKFDFLRNRRNLRNRNEIAKFFYVPNFPGKFPI